MQKNPYIVLGVDENASESEIRAAHQSLKKQYGEKLFAEGDEGMEASKKLSEIDVALNDCLENLQKKNFSDDFGGVFGEVERCIKDGRLDKAQSLLDDIESRNAEWHYFQAMIYYKKSWFLDSKKQLQIAVAMEETNEKYKKSLEKLDAMLKNPQPDAGAQQQRAGYQQQQYTGADNANACCNSCATLCCLDSCCECMGGDLCPCC